MLRPGGGLRLLTVPFANVNLETLLESVTDTERQMRKLTSECSSIGCVLQSYSDACSLDVGRLVSRDGVKFEIKTSLLDVPLVPGQKYTHVTGYTWSSRTPPLERTRLLCKSVLEEYWSLVQKHRTLMHKYSLSYSSLRKSLFRKVLAEKVAGPDCASAVLYYELGGNEYYVQTFDFTSAVLEPGKMRPLKITSDAESAMRYVGLQADVYLVRNYSSELKAEEVLNYVSRELLERYKQENPDIVQAARKRFREEVGVERAEERLRGRIVG